MKRVALFAAAALALAVAGVAAAQDGGSLRLTFNGTAEQPYPDAQVIVTVEDASGASLTGLDAGSFAITVDGKPTTVSKAELVSSTTSPLDVLLMIDTSGSTEGVALAEAKNAAVAFIRSLAPEDRVAIMRFANSVTVQQDFTNDKEAAIAAVNALVSRGQTELYKAAAGAINQAATSTSARRAVVFLTDGAQDAIVTDVTADQAIGLARSTGIPVFTIALGAAIQDSSFIQDLASVSGGRYLEAPTPGDLTNVYQSVGRLLQNQYAVTFDASEASGKPESQISVQVTASGGRTANASGVFAPSAAFVAPSVTVTGLTAGETLEEARDVSVTSAATKPIEKAAFYVDNVNVFETSEAPFSFTYDPDEYGEGEHSLRVAATIDGRVIDSEGVAFRSVPSAPVVTDEPGDGGGGGLPVLPIAGVLGALAVVGAAFLVYQRIKVTSGPSLEMVSPDQRVTPWATRHRAITKPPIDDEDAVIDDSSPAEDIGEALGVLISRAGPDMGQEYAVGGKPVSIGSGARCAVRINDAQMATEEARIWIRNKTLMLHRMTRLTTIATDGVSGGWQMLDPGETFKIGEHLFEFRLLPDGATAPESSAPKGDIPNILRDKSDEPQPRPSAPPLPEPGLASNEGPRRLTDMMPRDMGFEHQDLAEGEERAS
jgi:VWFA-related protein